MGSGEVHFVRCLKCQKILKCSRYDTAALLQHIRSDHPEVEIVDSDSKLAKRKVDKSTEISNRNSSPQPPNEQEAGDEEARRPPEKSETIIDAKEDKDFEAVPRSVRRINFESSQENTESAPIYVPEEDLTHLSMRSELLEKYPEIKNCEFCPRDPNAKVIYTRRYKIKTPSSISAINTNVVRKPRKRHLYRISIEKWRPTGGIIYCPKCGCNERPLIETRTERITENQWCACCLLNCWPLCFLPWIFPGHEVEHLHCSRCKAFLGVYNRHSNCLKPNRDFMITGHNRNVKLKPFPINQEETKINSYKRRRAETVGDHVKTDPNRLPTIVIDGKPLHPDMVARLQRFRKFGSLAGIDLEAVSEANQKTTNQINYNDDSLRDGVHHKPASTAGNK